MTDKKLITFAGKLGVFVLDETDPSIERWVAPSSAHQVLITLQRTLRVTVSDDGNDFVRILFGHEENSTATTVRVKLSGAKFFLTPFEGAVNYTISNTNPVHN